MKIRPADFSKSFLLSEPAIFSSGRFFVSWNNCLYEIIYKILLQDSMMFSGGYQATWLIWWVFWWKQNAKFVCKSWSLNRWTTCDHAVSFRFKNNFLETLNIITLSRLYSKWFILKSIVNVLSKCWDKCCTVNKWSL